MVGANRTMGTLDLPTAWLGIPCFYLGDGLLLVVALGSAYHNLSTLDILGSISPGLLPNGKSSIGSMSPCHGSTKMS